jgi:hypothetical protein
MLSTVLVANTLERHSHAENLHQSLWLWCADISAICLHGTHDPDKPEQEHLGTTMTWHALVASTSGTGIRLRLHIGPAAWRHTPTESTRLLAAVSRPELVRRLTALDIYVSNARDVAAVHSLAALRHLRLWSNTGGGLELFAAAPGAQPQPPPCQLSRLRSLQLHDTWPEAFFTPGVDANLQQLRSVCLCDCRMEGDAEGFPQFPPEALRLPSLERLELVRLLLDELPDMRRLPALHTLVISDAPELCYYTPHMSVLGGATGLTQLSLHNTSVTEKEAADIIIEDMPHLKELRLDFWGRPEAAYWAATLQRRLQGRCNVQQASEHLVPD